jgi:hypothetical protein
MPEVISIFLAAESEAALAARLVGRATEPIEKLVTRVQTAREVRGSRARVETRTKGASAVPEVAGLGWSQVRRCAVVGWETSGFPGLPKLTNRSALNARRRKTPGDRAHGGV